MTQWWEKYSCSAESLQCVGMRKIKLWSGKAFEDWFDHREPVWQWQPLPAGISLSFAA